MPRQSTDSSKGWVPRVLIAVLASALIAVIGWSVGGNDKVEEVEFKEYAKTNNTEHTTIKADVKFSTTQELMYEDIKEIKQAVKN